MVITRAGCLRERLQVQTCQPLIKKNLETHEKKSGDFTKSGEILFFPNQDQTNPFSIVGRGGGGIKLLFKHYLALYVVSVVTRYHFF